MNNYFFFLPFHLFLIIECQIVFDFKKEITSFNKETFSEYILNNKYISSLSIGTPKKEIPFYINFTDHYFYITHKDINGEYNNQDSSSYINLNKTNSYSFENIERCHLSKENFYFTNYTNKKYSVEKTGFLLVTNVKKKKEKELSQIGLTPLFFLELYEYNFINQLRKNKNINSYDFYFNYEDELKGKLYIGVKPHDSENKKFSDEDYKILKIMLDDMSFTWILNFDSINFDDIQIDRLKVKFDANFLGIFPPENLKDLIKEKYFDEFINKKICSLEKNDGYDFSFFVCDKSFDIKKIKPINFINKEHNFTFSLTYKDLFIEKDGKYYCLILYEKKTSIKRSTWYIGEIFLKKYILVFNEEKKTIGFYVKYKSNNFFVSVPWFLVFILLIIVFILGFILYKYVHNKRKIRVNELEEIYEYVSKDNYQSI